MVWEEMPEWVHFLGLHDIPLRRRKPKLHCIGNGKEKEAANFFCFLDLTLGEQTFLQSLARLARLLRSRPAVPFDEKCPYSARATPVAPLRAASKVAQVFHSSFPFLPLTLAGTFLKVVSVRVSDSILLSQHLIKSSLCDVKYFTI